MPGQKFNHKPIKEPWLLDLASMARAWQCFQFALRYAFLQREGPLMAIIFAAGQNNRRTGDALEKPFRVRLCQRSELMDDALDIGVSVAFGEKVREKMRQRSRAKGCAQVFEGVGPAVSDSIGSVVGDSSFGEFFARVVSSPA